ncbi:hypothetical protein AAVH_10419 [Aphelenchoides avenae]|nr:hypothetical protein AAVH_10419 [Aphelenchus avenae]
MATPKENNRWQLPNGTWVEEASGQEGLCAVERVLGTRLKYKYRYWLIQFAGYNGLMWIGARGCRCNWAIKSFLNQMHWDKPPMDDIEHFHPSLLQPAAPQTEPQPSAAAARHNPPPVAHAVAPKKKDNSEKSKKMEPVNLLSGLEDEEESQDEDDQPKKAPRKRSYTETSTASEPAASRGGGNKSKPFDGAQKTTNSMREKTGRSVQGLSAVAAAALPPKPRQQTHADKTQQEEIAKPGEKESFVSQDEGEQAKKASTKRAYADSSKTPEPSASGGGKKPLLFSGMPTSPPALAAKTARRETDDKAHAAVPQLKPSVAATAKATTNAMPTTNGAASAAVPSQPHQPYGFQKGLKLLAIIDVRHEAGRGMAVVRYDNGVKELVPTALLAQHEAKMLNAYYADCDRLKTSGN